MPNSKRYIAMMMQAEAEGRFDLSTKGILGLDSDDERLYWWHKGDFTLSSEMWSWLGKVKTKYNRIKEAIASSGKVANDTIYRLCSVLRKIDDVYDRLVVYV